MATPKSQAADSPATITQLIVTDNFIRGMESLRHILVKGTLALNASALPAARLYEDMLPLTFQVHACCNASLGAITKLADADVPKWPEEDDDENLTLEALIVAVDAALVALHGVDGAALAAADRLGVIHYDIGGYGPMDLPVKNWLLGWSLPMFMFHLVTAYDILRHNGVTLGKKDYMASFLTPWTPVSLTGHLEANLAEDIEAKKARDQKVRVRDEADVPNGRFKVHDVN